MLLIVILISLIIIYLIFNEKNYVKWGIIISFILIATIFAFRNNIGVDDARYRHFFEIVSTHNTKMYWDLKGVEKTYIILSSIFAALGLNYKSIFFFYAIISFIFLIKVTQALKLSKNESFFWILCFISFCFVPYITVMRQFAASMIALYAFVKFNWQHPIKPLILLALATMIHVSSIIFLPLYFIKNLHFKKELYFYLVFPLVSLIISLTPFWQIIGSILNSLGINGYAHYINGSNSLSGTGIVIFATYIIYVVSILLIKHKQHNLIMDPTINIFVKLGSLFFFLFFLTWKTGYVGRIYYPFYLFVGTSLITIYRYCTLNQIKTYYVFTGILFILSAKITYDILKTNLNIYNFENFSVDLIERENK